MFILHKLLSRTGVRQLSLRTVEDSETGSIVLADISFLAFLLFILSTTSASSRVCLSRSRRRRHDLVFDLGRRHATVDIHLISIVHCRRSIRG